MKTKVSPRAGMLTINDVAEELNLSAKTIRRKVESGELHVHRFGRALRVALEDLAAYRNQKRE